MTLPPYLPSLPLRRDTAPQAGCAMTLDEIGLVLGISKERVRQLERAALRKCRRALERRGITAEVWLEHLADIGRRTESPWDAW